MVQPSSVIHIGDVPGVGWRHSVIRLTRRARERLLLPGTPPPPPKGHQLRPRLYDDMIIIILWAEDNYCQKRVSL